MSGDSLKIMAFDDQDVVLEGLKLAVSGLGHKFIPIQILDADDVVTLNAKDFEGIDVVITDMDMGDPRAGLAVLSQVRKMAPGVKVILNSGSATAEEAAQFDAMLNKTGAAREQVQKALVALRLQPATPQITSKKAAASLNR